MDYGSTNRVNENETKQENDESEAATYNYEASSVSPTTRPNLSATTAKVGASVEVPLPNIDVEAAKGENGSLSINKVRS